MFMATQACSIYTFSNLVHSIPIYKSLALDICPETLALVPKPRCPCPNFQVLNRISKALYSSIVHELICNISSLWCNFNECLMK